MGNCGSNPDAKPNKALEEQLRSDHKADLQKIKLLLLGAGESGKSTIFKQMRILYGVGFGDKDRREARATVHRNALSGIKVLVEQADALGFIISSALGEDVALIKSVDESKEIDPKLGEAIGRLWTDPGIRQTFDNRSRFQLVDSVGFYLDKIDRISKPDYLPSVDDVLRSRVRTSGIVSESYNIDGVQFEMYDVGGQRNERKKWIHCFESVTAVIFVASMSEYDQVLYEDNTTNRVDEAVQLFQEIYESRWFQRSAIILFLNKRDLFEDKIKRIDVRHFGDEAAGIAPRFLDYDKGTCRCGGGYPSSSPCTCGAQEAAKNYITKLFLDRTTPTKKIACHVTCATDTKNVETVFNVCKEKILEENVRNSGFMD